MHFLTFHTQHYVIVITRKISVSAHWTHDQLARMNFQIFSLIFFLVLNVTGLLGAPSQPTFNKMKEWKTFQQFITNKRILDRTEVFSTIAKQDQAKKEAKSHDRKRKGPFLSMFPGSAPHPNVTIEQVGEPLILTPLLEAGQVQKARDLAKVEGLSANVKTFSGFFTVNKKYDSNLFFWYAPSQVRKFIKI